MFSTRRSNLLRGTQLRKFSTRRSNQGKVSRQDRKNVRGQADPEAAALDEEDGVLGPDGDPGPRYLPGEGEVLGGAPEPGHRPAAGLGQEGLRLGVGQAIKPGEEVGDGGLGIILLCLAVAVSNQHPSNWFL